MEHKIRFMNVGYKSLLCNFSMAFYTFFDGWLQAKTLYSSGFIEKKEGKSAQKSLILI